MECLGAPALIVTGMPIEPYLVRDTPCRWHRLGVRFGRAAFPAAKAHWHARWRLQGLEEPGCRSDAITRHSAPT
eukprot:7624424-Lingulodinium_polyedra.AAC.1